MPPKKKKGTVAALKVRNKVHKKNMRKVVPKMPKQDNQQNTQPIKITIKTPEKKESSSAPPKNESVAKVSTPTPQVSKPIISSTPVAPTVSSVSTTAEVEPSFDWTKFGTKTANYIASGNAIRDAKNDPGKLITSLASAASLSSINPYVGMAAAAVSLGKYGYDSYNEYNKKKKKKAKEKTRKHIANVMDITNTNDLYRLQYMRRQEKLLRQGFNAFRAKNIRDELAKQRIIESEVAINRRNQIKDMYDKIMRFKKKIEKEKAKEDSKAVLEELNKKKVITQKELRTTTKRNEHAEAYNKKPDPMPLTAAQQDVAMKLFDAYMARAPNYIQQETDYVIPSGSALARADEITKQRVVKNETTKWNSSDQALYESILRRPGNAEMLLTNMSTPVLFPQLWANKLEDQLAKKQWWSNIKSIGLTTASTLLQLLRVVPSNDTKLQALNTINDKINSLNISDRYKDLLTRGANIIAENVFDTNKKLVDESYAKLNNLKALADLVATEDVNRDYLVKKLEEINETTPELPKMELSQADKDYISSYIHTPWFQKNVLGKNQPKTDRQKAIINILTNDGNRWINAKNQDEAAIDLVRMSLGTAEAFGGISNEGKPNYLTKIEQKKIEENVKELPDTWQGILMKAGFGNKEEAMNAKRKLQDAGIRNYDDAINRKNQIEAYITSFGHDGKNINDIMNEMMFMPQQQFEKYVQDRIDQDKNERYKAVFEKGIDYIKAVADNIKELKEIQKERARNKRDLERAKDDTDVETRFLNLRDTLFKDFDANEFKNGEDDFFANEEADRNRNQILKTFFVIKDNFGSPKEEVFKQWWETKGKQRATNSKGKNIFSLEANKTQEDREEANRIGKDLVHEYIVDVQNNIADSPITIAGQKMVPWMQNESEGIRDDIMNIRNKFTYGSNSVSREFDRFDAIRQGLIENALTEKNSQIKDMLSYIPDEELKDFSIQGIKRLIKAANSINDPQRLKLTAQNIAKDEKAISTKQYLFYLNAFPNMLDQLIPKKASDEYRKEYEKAYKKMPPMIASNLSSDIIYSHVVILLYFPSINLNFNETCLRLLLAPRSL